MYIAPSFLPYVQLLPLISLFLFLLECAPSVEATSSALRPLSHITEPSLTLERYPRTQHLRRKSISSSYYSDTSRTTVHSDTLRLTVSVYGEKYVLHLIPNDYLLHPSARVKYFKADDNGQITLDRTEPVVRNQVKAYLGEVIHPDHSDGRLQEDLAGGVVNSKYSSFGWARIIIYNEGNPRLGVSPNLEGAFTVNGIPYHVMTRDKYMRLKHTQDPVPDTQDDHSLVVFRDSDIADSHQDSNDAQHPPSNEHSHFCSHDTLSWNKNPGPNPVFRQPKLPTWLDELAYGNTWTKVDPNRSMWRRDDVVGNNVDGNFESHIGQTTGCPTSPVTLYMGVAADCNYVQKYGSQENATKAIINDWNMASAVYQKTFNVNLAIVELSIHDPTCPVSPDPAFPWNTECSPGTDLNSRLSIFSQWRGTQSNDQAGLWHLMSGCPTGTEIGVAWINTLCQTTTTGSPGEFISGTALTTANRNEWQVVAHEIGHNFGAIHDCIDGCNSTTSCCPLSTSQCNSNEKFIMSPNSQPGQVAFSPCSVGNICSLMQSKTVNATCLKPPEEAIQTISLGMCGNGIVEDGEECDPGIGVNSTCCDQKTCKFTSGAICDPSNGGCCTSQCQFAPSTQVCRAALDSQCDFPEMCNGTSAQCPWDRTQPNGLSCGNGLACASGQCTSLNQQCQNVGASLGLQQACESKGDTSCQVNCQTPGNPAECTELQAQLIDGSPCGYGGSCSNGACIPGSFAGAVKSWYKQNPQIAIPITILGGILIIIILWTSIRCVLRRDWCCRRYPKKGKIVPSALAAQPSISHIGPSPSEQTLVASRDPSLSAPRPPPAVVMQERLRKPQQTSLSKMNVKPSIRFSDEVALL